MLVRSRTPESFVRDSECPVLLFRRGSRLFGIIYGIILFCFFQFFEFLVPVGFRRTDNQPVFWIGEHKLPLCSVSFILCAFDREEPLLFRQPLCIMDAAHDFQGDLKLRRLHDGEDFFGDCMVKGFSRDGRTSCFIAMLPAANTFV